MEYAKYMTSLSFILELESFVCHDLFGVMQVASYYGWPVSTTHCIVGSMVGFGLAYGGVGAVFWSSLARVISSWVISPLMGALVSFLVYKFIRRVCSHSLDLDKQAHCLTSCLGLPSGWRLKSCSLLP
jgi:phosphate/sulfate permease